MSRDETKHDRFVRLAESRVNNAIKSIELIGNLSNLNNYDYTEKEAKKIVSALKKTLDNVEKKFMTSSKTNFKL